MMNVRIVLAADPISNDCYHCFGEGHGDIVCNCGFTHAEHIFAIGLPLSYGVICNRYSQTKLRKIHETDEQFYIRTGFKTIRADDDLLRQYA